MNSRRAPNESDLGDTVAHRHRHETPGPAPLDNNGDFNHQSLTMVIVSACTAVEVVLDDTMRVPMTGVDVDLAKIV